MKSSRPLINVVYCAAVSAHRLTLEVVDEDGPKSVILFDPLQAMIDSWADPMSDLSVCGHTV